MRAGMFMLRCAFCVSFSLNLVRKLSCTSFLSLFHVIFCIFSTFVSDILCPIGRTRSQTKRLKVSITAGFVTGRVVLDLCTLMARREARYRGRGVPYEIQWVGQLFISTMRKVTGSRSIDEGVPDSTPRGPFSHILTYPLRLLVTAGQ